MKKIVMDFKTYEDEIKTARSQGAESVKDLAKKLEAILKILNYDTSHENLMRARHELASLLNLAKGNKK